MTNQNSTEDLSRIIAEATGHSPRVLPTGGGCEVLAWRSSEYVCWLSDDDARIPTEPEYGLVLGIYLPDSPEGLWPSEESCEGEHYFYASDATPESLAHLLIEAREVVR